MIGRVSTVDGSTAVRVCARGTCGPKFMDRSMDQFETWRRQQDPRRPAALHAAFTDAYTTLTSATPRPPPRRAPLRLGLWHTHGCGYDGILLNLSDLSDAGAAAIHCLPLDLDEAPQNFTEIRIPRRGPGQPNRFLGDKGYLLARSRTTYPHLQPTVAAARAMCPLLII